MRHPRAVLAIGLAIAAVVAALTLAWGAAPPPPLSVEQVVYPAGAVIRVPESPVATFEVPSGGGVLVGDAKVDHTALIMAAPAGEFLNCTAVFNYYYGAPWSYSVNESLAPGQYDWGALCGGFANITITQPIEVLNP
jgi:hypothetical protein